MTAQGSIRRRRETCWWEPTYDPALVGVMAAGQWDFSHNRGPTRCHFDGADLTKEIKIGLSRVFREVVFTDCDFQGYFSHSAQLVFDNCRFIGFDFGLSTWINVKFSNCKFTRVSFGQTKFENCEFRSCDWVKIGISPNALEFTSTYFSSSAEFISAAFTNLDKDVLDKNKTNARDQTLRLEVTKATIARRILKMLQQEGDELAFYDAVRTFQLQHCRSGKSTATQTFFDVKEKKYTRALACLSIVSWTLEGIILRVFGAANGWGATVTKPVMLSVVSMLLFAGIYRLICVPTKVAPPLQRSFDISIIAGYTNYGSELDSITISIQNSQIFVSIILYSITFATIINRLSRVR